MVMGDGGFVAKDETRESLTIYMQNENQLELLNEHNIPLLDKDQPKIQFDLTVTKPGPHVLVITYITPEDDLRMHNISIQASSQKERINGEAVLPSCPYTSPCRQVILDTQKRINIFNFDTNFIQILLKGDETTNVGIKSITAIPYDEWSLDYIRPKSICVKKDGVCVKSEFPTAPGSKKVRFELGNEKLVTDKKPPNVFDNQTNLIFLNGEETMIDIRSKVPQPGYYVFVIQYYQPNFPEFDMDVLIQNGQFYEAKLPLKHCPSNSGCREIVRQEDGNTQFTLTENFVLTMKNPDSKSVWLDYVLVIPASSYSPSFLNEENFDQTGEFISNCGSNHFYINETAEGKIFCHLETSGGKILQLN